MEALEAAVATEPEEEALAPVAPVVATAAEAVDVVMDAAPLLEVDEGLGQIPAEIEGPQVDMVQVEAEVEFDAPENMDIAPPKDDVSKQIDNGPKQIIEETPP